LPYYAYAAGGTRHAPHKLQSHTHTHSTRCTLQFAHISVPTRHTRTRNPQPACTPYQQSGPRLCVAQKLHISYIVYAISSITSALRPATTLHVYAHMRAYAPLAHVHSHTHTHIALAALPYINDHTSRVISRAHRIGHSAHSRRPQALQQLSSLQPPLRAPPAARSINQSSRAAAELA
jgi:hypothetical protein